MKGQRQAKLSQILKLKKAYKTCLSYPDMSQEYKNVVCFHVMQTEMPKMRFKNDFITFPCFLSLHSQK